MNHEYTISQALYQLSYESSLFICVFILKKHIQVSMFLSIKNPVFAQFLKFFGASSQFFFTFAQFY